MTALGIGVSSNDHTFGWSDIHTRKHSKLEVALIEAREEAVAAWNKVTGDIGECLLAQGDYDGLQELQDAATLADKRAHMIYVQLHGCVHEFDEDSGCCIRCGVDYFDVYEVANAVVREEIPV